MHPVLNVRFCAPIALTLLLQSTACSGDAVPFPRLEFPRAGDSDNEAPAASPASAFGQVGIDKSFLYYYTGNPGLLVGAPNAVPGSHRVVVVNPQRSNWEGATYSSPNGSFNLPLNAGISDVIGVFTELDGATAGSETLELEEPSVGAYAAQQRIAGPAAQEAGGDTDLASISVLPPDASGVVVVTGTLVRGITAVVANTDNGNASAAATAPDNSFTVRLEGGAGDMLQVFVVESAASNAGPKPVTLFVP